MKLPWSFGKAAVKALVWDGVEAILTFKVWTRTVV